MSEKNIMSTERLSLAAYMVANGCTRVSDDAEVFQIEGPGTLAEWRTAFNQSREKPFNEQMVILQALRRAQREKEAK